MRRPALQGHAASRTVIAAVTAALVAPLLLAGGCKGKPTAEPSVLALVPGQATLVAQANLTRLRQTRLFQKALSEKEKPAAGDPLKAYLEFRTETGFDLGRDLDSLTLAVPGDVDTSRTFLAIARGRFDEGRLVGFMTRKAAGKGGQVTEEIYKGIKLRGQSREPGARLAFLSPGTALFGSVDWVKRAIDLARGEGGDSLQKNALLTGLIQRTRVDRGLWAVAEVPEKLRDRLPVPGKKVTLKSGSVSLDLVAGLQLDLIADLASPAEAQSVVEAGNGGLGLLRGFGPVTMGGYGPYLEAIKLAARGPAAELTLGLTQVQLDELIDRLERFLTALKSSAAPAPATP